MPSSVDTSSGPDGLVGGLLVEGLVVESFSAASVYHVEAFVALSFAEMAALRSALYFVDLLKSREALFWVLLVLVLVWTP